MRFIHAQARAVRLRERQAAKGSVVVQGASIPVVISGQMPASCAGVVVASRARWQRFQSTTSSMVGVRTRSKRLPLMSSMPSKSQLAVWRTGLSASSDETLRVIV